jgi:hypothetical protein
MARVLTWVMQLTQEQLAELCGCKERLISQVECGVSTNQSVSTIEIISHDSCCVKLKPNPRTRRRLYRLAYHGPSSGYTQIGRAYLSFDFAGTGAVRQNAVRREFGLPALTHAVVYEEVGIKELTKSPK